MRRAMLLTLVVCGLTGWAQSLPADDEAPSRELHWQDGPAVVKLRSDLELKLPENMGFLAKDEAAKLLEKNGSFYNENLLGLVAPGAEGEQWVVIIRYDEEGYVKDDETIDAKELLTAIKDGTEEANEERVKRGFDKLTISDSWSETPHYDKQRHHLVWALEAGSAHGTSVNYNTRILGKAGVVSLNLVVSPEQLKQSQEITSTLLANTSFVAGARYEDFKSGDKVAEYGLGGLVLGGAGLGAMKLVKIGLFAKFWKVLLGVLLAAKKGIVIALAGLAGLLKRLFGRKAPESTPTPPTE